MKNLFFCFVLFITTDAFATSEKLYRFAIWRDDETKETYMAQVDKLAPVHLKEKCSYELTFCGQGVEVEKAEKVCAVKKTSTAKAPKLENHLGVMRLQFAIDVSSEESPGSLDRLELNFNSKSELLSKMSKIETFDKSASGDLKPKPFGDKAAFFELAMNCSQAR